MTTSRPIPPRRLAAARVAARVVDAFTVFFLTFGLAVTVLFPVMAPLTDLLEVEPWGRALGPLVVFLVTAVIYETVFVSRRGQTPGRDLCNVRVVDAQATTQTLSPERAALRAALMWAPLLIPDLRVAAVVYMVGAALLVVDAHRFGVVDRLLSTTTVAYDADVEEGPIGSSAGGADLERRYGPRLWRSLTGAVKP